MRILVNHRPRNTEPGKCTCDHNQTGIRPLSGVVLALRKHLDPGEVLIDSYRFCTQYSLPALLQNHFCSGQCDTVNPIRMCSQYAP